MNGKATQPVRVEVSRFEGFNDVDSDRSPKDSARLEEEISPVKFAKYDASGAECS